MEGNGHYMNELLVGDSKVRITNPEKVLFPDLGLRKIDYIAKLIELGPYILPHSKDRLLTTVRYPDGNEGKSFFQKNIPSYAPDWIEKADWNEIRYIILNSMATLIWLGNQAALEFHTSFNLLQNENKPTDLVFDLDPSEGQGFDEVSEAALCIHETLQGLNIESWVKTSGATGLQIYIPIGQRYDYDTARSINEFFGIYFSQKYPKIITIERMVSKRGKKLYFDYLQMWSGKTITMVYSPRATPKATVSMPVTWEEIKVGIHPEDFHILNAKERLRKMGDLFKPLLLQEHIQNLDIMLEHAK
jgi:bifunctional non-homologous end joining protein LigD